MALTELRVQSHPPFPTLSVLLGVAWLCSVVAASVLGYFPHAMAAAPIGAFGLVRWLRREQTITLELTSQGIVLDDSLDLIPYESIRSIQERQPVDSNGQFPIEINYRNSQIIVPSSIDHPSSELMMALTARIPEPTAGYVNPSLQTYLEDQLSTFGSDRVYCFSPRERATPAPQKPFTRAISTILFITSLAWGCSAFYSDIWIIPAVIMGVFAGLFFLISMAKHDTVAIQAPNWKESTLLVTPAGIALMQGKLKGKLRWDEVVSLKLAETPKFSITPVTPGLTVLVAGSQIVILDIYNKPLSHIHRIMKGYLDGESD